MILSVLLLLLAVGIFFAIEYLKNSLTTDGDRVQEIAARIVDMDLPEGFEETFASSFRGTHQAMYQRGGGTNLVSISLVELTGKRASQPEAAGLLAQTKVNGLDSQFEEKSKVQEMGVLMGQKLRFTKTLGHHAQLGEVRVLSTVFKTRDGIAKITLVYPESAWDENEVSRILKSLR